MDRRGPVPASTARVLRGLTATWLQRELAPLELAVEETRPALQTCFQATCHSTPATSSQPLPASTTEPPRRHPARCPIVARTVRPLLSRAMVDLMFDVPPARGDDAPAHSAVAARIARRDRGRAWPLITIEPTNGDHRCKEPRFFRTATSGHLPPSSSAALKSTCPPVSRPASRRWAARVGRLLRDGPRWRHHRRALHRTGPGVGARLVL